MTTIIYSTILIYLLDRKPTFPQISACTIRGVKIDMPWYILIQHMPRSIARKIRHKKNEFTIRLKDTRHLIEVAEGIMEMLKNSPGRHNILTSIWDLRKILMYYQTEWIIGIPGILHSLR